MKRLVRVAIQLEEAKRLVQVHDDEFDRLALILSDNVVELILYRLVSHKLRYEEQQRDQVRPLIGRDDLPLGLAEHRDKTLEVLMSRTQARRLEREFNPKVDFAESEGLVSSAESTTLKKLHTYRNEAQHRDSIRPETLRTTGKIYLWLACTLYARVPIRSVTSSGPSNRWPDVFRRIIGEEVDSVHDPFVLPKLFSEALLAGLGLESDHVGSLLSENVSSRLATMQEAIEYISSNSLGSGQLTFEYVLHSLQIEEDLGSGWLDPTVVKATSVPHSMAAFEAWTERARKLQEIPDPVRAFVVFSQLEDEMEKLEGQVRDTAVALDEAISLEVDRRLGK